jgi:hypothetical protein
MFAELHQETTIKENEGNYNNRKNNSNPTTSSSSNTNANPSPNPTLHFNNKHYLSLGEQNYIKACLGLMKAREKDGGPDLGIQSSQDSNMSVQFEGELGLGLGLGSVLSIGARVRVKVAV